MTQTQSIHSKTASKVDLLVRNFELLNDQLNVMILLMDCQVNSLLWIRIDLPLKVDSFY